MKLIKYKLNGQEMETVAESVEQLVHGLNVAPGTINITAIESIQDNLIQFKTSHFMEMIGLETQINNLILTYGYDSVKSVLNLKENFDVAAGVSLT